MNKYQRTPNLVVDLHGESVRRSHELLKDLIDNHTLSHVRIIVGKGIHSKATPVLREYVKEFLSSHNIRFAQSKIQDGGEGALEVYL